MSGVGVSRENTNTVRLEIVTCIRIHVLLSGVYIFQNENEHRSVNNLERSLQVSIFPRLCMCCVCCAYIDRVEEITDPTLTRAESVDLNQMAASLFCHALFWLPEGRVSSSWLS